MDAISKLKRLMTDFCPEYCADIVQVTNTHVIKEDDTQDHLWKVLMTVVRRGMAAKDKKVHIDYEYSFDEVVSLMYRRIYKNDDASGVVFFKTKNNDQLSEFIRQDKISVNHPDEQGSTTESEH